MQNEGQKRIAVIGCGNLGGALIKGIVGQGVASSAADVVACEVNAARVAELVADFGIMGTSDVAEAVKGAATVIIAVKPNTVADVVQTIAEVCSAEARRPVLISIAAGVTTDSIEQFGAAGFPLCRVMPNLACTIGFGLSALFGRSEDAVAEAQRIFSAIGRTIRVDREDDLNIATGLSASAPAFIFVAMEALADGAVRMGLARDKAQMMAVEMVFGAGALASKSGEHPARLKDMVASPGGTTIAGLQVLERGGYRGVLSDAVAASIERARELGRGNK